MDIWKPLRFLNLYRLSVSGLFTLLVLTHRLPEPLGSHSMALFSTISFVYLGFSTVNGLAILWRRPPFQVQVHLNVLVDILAITLLIHASGGVVSGLGMLLIVTIAGTGILLARRLAGLAAAAATFALFGQQFYAHLANTLPIDYTHTGILGASFFAIAYLSHFLARRIRESEDLAAKRGVDLTNMAQLTEAIIQRMQTGVIVVDDDQRVHLQNASAGQLLKTTSPPPATSLRGLSPELATQFQEWQTVADFQPRRFRTTNTAPTILPGFARLRTGEGPATLIFLEDTAAMQQQAQQLKLASLGRLTASIAHEIRNPLGAISHAGQLLRETPTLPEGDQRLTEIICNQSKRMNSIVESILGLSRRDCPQAILFELQPWIDNFVEELAQVHHLEAGMISTAVDVAHLEIRMPPEHLHQILTNLCQNGLRHTRDLPHTPSLNIHAGVSNKTRRPFLEVIDQGPGVPPELTQHLFEPFFTTEKEGTGLGLYIARQMAECNQAQLDYVPHAGAGSCFRLTFMHPGRLKA